MNRLKKKILVIGIVLGMLLSFEGSTVWAKLVYDPPWASNFGTIYPDGTDSKVAANAATFWLSHIGYNANTLTEINNSKYLAEDLLRQDAIFSFTGHAAPGVLVFWDGTEKNYLFADSDLRKLSHLEDVLFAAYIGCNTAQTDDIYGNFLTTSTKEGIDSTLGFKESIYVEHTNYWSERFWYWASQNGYTLREAAQKASRDVRSQFGDYGNTESFGFDGAVSNPAATEINPARYGEWKSQKSGVSKPPSNNIGGLGEIPGNLADTSIQSVREFTSKPDLTVEPLRIERRRRREVIVLKAEGVEYEVDTSTREVVSMYSKKAESRNTKKVNFDLDKAHDIAQDFVFEKFIHFSKTGMELVKTELQDHGSYAEYSFEWKNINSPSFVNITVGPTTGEVIAYHAWWDETKIDSDPKIGREEVIEIAKNLVDFKVDKVKKTDLQAWYDGENRPVLQWVVELKGIPRKVKVEGKSVGIAQGALIVIDAHTAKVLQVSKTL